MIAANNHWLNERWAFENIFDNASFAAVCDFLGLAVVDIEELFPDRDQTDGITWLGSRLE